MRKTARITILMVLIYCLAQLSALAQQTPLTGSSSTLLPDGSTLLTGGYGPQGAPLADAVITSPNSPPQKLPAGLNVARAGHTATLLPDGTVFIFGGFGPDGKIVSAAELFDPDTQKFSLLPDVLAVPRAFHTATVLTDGTVLLAGGVEAGNEFPDDVQLWNFQTRSALSQHALLMMPREGHTATLMADGAVRISGGTDHFGRPVLVDEIYDPDTKRVRFANSGEMGQQDAQSQDEPRIATSIPLDGANDVAIDSFIAIRFTRLLNVLAATSGHFVLTGPEMARVDAKITAAENGRLVFVLPSSPLQPGTNYTLTVKGATDSSNTELAETSITFTTAGEPSAGPGADWTPNSTWTDPGGTTQFQQLKPLQAAPGVTALAGQVLKLNGWPLQHVSLEMDGNRAETDPTGRFLLKNLTAGHHVLWIDGSTASTPDAKYGIYEVGVTILPNQTNVLNYTIWMTRLDTAHAVTIPSPTTSETVITNPNLPGLELHLPAGTVITDHYGKVVREVSITAIPLNKPPFPLPAGVQVPIYFTIQPGGAYIKVLNGGNGPQGARLIYPNGFNLSPGMPFDFWNYDADVKGWYIYGHGRVSANRSQIIPDPGVLIYEFTGAMTSSTGGGPQACLPGQCKKAADADPVSLSTGEFVYEKTDLFLADTIPLSFSRTYISGDSRSRSFGIGANDSYDIFMLGDSNPYTYQELVLPDGARIRFDRITSGTGFRDAVYSAVGADTPFYGARISWTDDSIDFPGPWKMVLKDGTTYSFPDGSASTDPTCQAVLQIMDRYGNKVKMTRQPAQSGTRCVLTQISSPHGRYINITTDTSERITQATDNSGRSVLYSYDTAGRLSTVTDVGSGITTYTYDDQNRMLTIKDARQIVYLTNHYDSAGHVIEQDEIDTGTYRFNWTTTSNNVQISEFGGSTAPSGTVILTSGCWTGSSVNRYSSACSQGYAPLISQVDVTDPRGYIREVKFGSLGYVSSDTHALGQPEQQAVTYQYYADNTLQSITDALGRVTSFDYDGLGNVTRVTRLDGTPNAVTTTAGYNGPFSQVDTMTDPLGHQTTFNYDSFGNLTTATDALGHPTNFGHNGAGQLTSATDALNNSVQFSYFGGDLATITDPLGNVSTQFTDAVGRVISSTDAQGNSTKDQYNNLNLRNQVTDAQGNLTQFSYDPNGNLLSLTDARTNPTTYTYDNMDRVQTRTDPLLRPPESYTYDLNGNLSTTTDRKGQVTSFSYDGLNRLTFVGFNTVVNGGTTTYESTISYTYDAGNRMTQATNTCSTVAPGCVNEIITRGYDNLDRLTSETTPQGTISYTYDNAGRRSTMQVTGQPIVNYTYDNADRLTQITQGTSITSFGYDNADRRTSLTLPNNVVVSYGYDNDSQLTSVTYQLGSNTLGNLTYGYDQLGRRTQIGGSFARTGLPGAVTSTFYDAANEVTNWNGLALSYDQNGNMLSDGANTFTWNARNEVATLNNVSLTYDAFGRRIQNAAGTSFLYDGANAAQELSGTTVTANLLSGGIDEVFSRTDGSGAFTPLKDALGSTISLVDSNGNVQTSYTYDPYGGTSVTGTSNGNEFQYTGRENEGNGLYFYRARYYSPLLGRFISEDPLGFVGSGPNLYAYVFDSPTNLVDPFGLSGGPTGVMDPPVAPPQQAPAPPPVAPVVPVVPVAPVIPVPGPVMTLVAGGSAEGSSAGPIGVVVGIGVAATGGIIYQRVKYNQAVDNEDAAYDQEMQAIHKMNQALLGHPRPLPLPLAGRKSRPDNQSSSPSGRQAKCYLVFQTLRSCEYSCEDGTKYVTPGQIVCPAVVYKNWGE